jgi:hypothetical protein
VTLARLTVDRATGEIIEVRGDYPPDALRQIDARRPRDVMSAAEAIEMADAWGQRMDPGTNARVSRTEVDLFASRYYILRYYGGPVRKGVLRNLYGYIITIDGKTRQFVSMESNVL